MALVTIAALLAAFLIFRTKAYGLAIVCLCAGLLLAATSPGKSVVDGLTSVSKTVDTWFK